MIYNLIDKNNPILKQPTSFFDFDDPPVDPVELFENMKETMIAHRGIGLACNQVGLPYSMFVLGNPGEPDTIFSVFNPKIVNVSDEQDYIEEGCLSYPGLFIKIKRALAIRVRYTSHNGVTDSINLGGITARAFLHEYDHLCGVKFVEIANKVHLDRAKNQQKKLNRMKKNQGVEIG